MTIQKIKKIKKVNKSNNKKNVVRIVNFNDIKNENNVTGINRILQKISSMLHFANKTRKISIGLNNTLYLNPRVIGIVLVSENLGESSKQKLISHCSAGTPIYLFNANSNYPNDLFYTGEKENKENSDVENDKKIKVISIQNSEFSKKIDDYLKEL